ncbi:hypothetical protein H8784_04835 [Parabacteroides acidifaciens]|uniref:Uncharacterized protein n=1 Tax=Parabacteroides acidifaciens TaxID=2290935 RepID=A0A3D8HHY6_9BACT|nr:hypothetical protein [Parabacteroides acidifaciens]MBC8601045.1 hypothetical protein [Parabacteroides acidifaciens]RDU50312.1 hypothetical protein DWU89_04930 [Parabacteroides acidifaciens]
MKKQKTYQTPPTRSSVNEPAAVYHTDLPFLSREEALKTGMLLAESKRILFDKIRQDFKR